MLNHCLDELSVVHSTTLICLQLQSTEQKHTSEL